MIEEFIASWPLFGHTYIAGGVIAFLLAGIGWFIVARDQIFIGAAVAQASTLGIAVSLYLGLSLGNVGHAPAEQGWFSAAWAVGLSIVAALCTGFGGREGKLSREGLTGWIFLLSSCGSVLLLYHTPIGTKEITQRLSSSIIGASSNEIILFLVLALATGTAVIVKRRLWVLFALDPSMAAALGLRLWRLECIWALWLGLIMGLAIRSCGTLFAFGCLVLPPLAANQWCKEVSTLMVVSPLVGLGCSVLGFILANYYDYPPGQMAVAVLSGFVALAWITRVVWSRTF